MHMCIICTYLLVDTPHASPERLAQDRQRLVGLPDGAKASEKKQTKKTKEKQDRLSVFRVVGKARRVGPWEGTGGAETPSPRDNGGETRTTSYQDIPAG